MSKYILQAIPGVEYVQRIAEDGYVHMTKEPDKAEVFTERGLDGAHRVRIRKLIRKQIGGAVAVVRIL